MRASRMARAAGVALAVAGLGGVALGATAERQEVWEYHVVYGAVTANALNRAGADGWELVSVFQNVRGEVGRAVPDELRGGVRTNTTADATITAVFKRPAR